MSPFDNYYRYFLLGIIICQLLNRRTINRNANYIMLTATIVAFLLSGALLPLGYLYLLSNGLIYIAFTTINVNRLSKWIISLDKASMGIYLIHHPIIWNLVKYSQTQSILAEHYILAPIIVTAVVLVVS